MHKTLAAAGLAPALLLIAAAACFAAPDLSTLAACQADDRMVSKLGTDQYFRAQAFARCVATAKAAPSEGAKQAALDTCPE